MWLNSRCLGWTLTADVLVIGKKIRLRLDGRTVFIDQNKV
ncbi:hypothetical protein DES30_1183, partial [Prauserella marina]